MSVTREQLDAWIRADRWAEAREALASRARSKGFLQQPVDELTAWAQIARRCGSPIDGA
ncbi:MAG: hypothetical protein IT285_00025, partial [Bdellovibrionales bacterium]|nr:hypothetical protein [Bdellovibrionales bacterium]